MGLKGFVNDDGSAKYKDYADYIVNHERRPGVGPLIGFRGETGQEEGRGAPNPDQMQAYIDNGGFYEIHVPEGADYYKPWNAAYQDWAVKIGIYDAPQPYLFDIYSEPMRRFQLAAEGHGERQPPEHLRAQIKQTLDPLPMWYAPFEDGAVDVEEFPVHALTQRPMAMYHSWGHAKRLAAANPWAKSAVCADQDLAGQRLCRGRLGAGHLRAWLDCGAGCTYGCAERKHCLDLERDWQAQGGLGLG
jgi:anaerobic selenocysteine-containing dehydrogenase